MNNDILNHNMRVALIVRKIGQKLNLDEKDLTLLTMSGIYHDIGKFKISRAILDKPCKLSETEYKVIQFHSELGAEMLQDYNLKNKVIIDAVKYHHERFDGGGYPEHKKGYDIPLFARIIAVADTYDAITSIRKYSKAHSCEYALKEIEINSGTQFDPKIVEIFKNIIVEVGENNG